MPDKLLSSLQKIFGDSHSGRCQKKYRHRKQYEFFKGQYAVGLVTFDYEISDGDLKKELMDFKEKTKADRIELRWTAMRGFVHEEVPI